MANTGVSPAKQALTQKPKKQSQRRNAARRKEENDRLERIRLQYLSYQHCRDSMAQQHDFRLTVTAAQKSLDLIELALKESVRLLPPLQEIALVHSADNCDAQRTFQSIDEEETLPKIAKGVKELSSKLESLLADVGSFYRVFGPFAQGVTDVNETPSANIFCQYMQAGGLTSPLPHFQEGGQQP